MHSNSPEFKIPDMLSADVQLAQIVTWTHNPYRIQWNFKKKIGKYKCGSQTYSMKYTF